jgi:hypothetical protein
MEINRAAAALLLGLIEIRILYIVIVHDIARRHLKTTNSVNRAAQIKTLAALQKCQH